MRERKINSRVSWVNHSIHRNILTVMKGWARVDKVLVCAWLDYWCYREGIDEGKMQSGVAWMARRNVVVDVGRF